MRNEDAQFFKRIGICVVCKKRKAAPGRVSCFDCLERDRARKAEMRKSWSLEERDYKNAERRKYEQNLREKRKADGICVRCGKREQYNGTLMCIDCYLKAKRYFSNRPSKARESQEQKKERLIFQAKHMREVSGVSSHQRSAIDRLWDLCKENV